MVTIKQVAERVKKTEAAVSLALNDRAGVSESTRKYIKKVAAEMGYVPNLNARELSAGHCRIVGLVIPDLENPFFAKLASEINRELRARGYQLLLAESSQNHDTENDIIIDFIARRVEGIIISPVTEDIAHVKYAERLTASGIPFVFAASYYRSWDAPCVMSDLFAGEKLVYEHLLRLGHRKILFLGTSESSLSTSGRLAGARDACREAGLDPDETVTFRNVKLPNYDYAFEYVSSHISRSFPYTAITAINDIMAFGVLKALRSGGISVPRDISLVGFDNLIFTEFSTIPLTTVEQDRTLIAELSVNSITGGNTPDCTTLLTAPKLMLRGSTAAVSD